MSRLARVVVPVPLTPLTHCGNRRLTVFFESDYATFLAIMRDVFVRANASTRAN